MSRICAFLKREEGARWRHAVYLNTERILREDSESAGATALMICLGAQGWVAREEGELDRLFTLLWQKKATLGPGLGALAEVAAQARAASALLAYWQARAVHAEDAAAGLLCWRALLERENVPREHVHEAATVLGRAGESRFAMLAARTSPNAEGAWIAYTALHGINLCQTAVVQEESIAILDAVGNEGERAETLVGLLLAARSRGASGRDLVDILDAQWPRLEPALSDGVLTLLLEALAGPLAADPRWFSRLVHFLGQERGDLLRGAILGWCGRFLEQGGRFSEEDTRQIVDDLCRIDPPPPVPQAVLEHLWDWAIERKHPEVVRSLLSLNLAEEARAVRQSLVADFMARLLGSRPGRLRKVTEALATLDRLQGSAPPGEVGLQALASGADLCPILAAAYVAWWEECSTRPRASLEAQANLFKVYVRIGLVRKAVKMAKAIWGLKAVLGVAPRRYVALHPRAEVAWGRSGWDNDLVSDFRRFLQKRDASRGQW